MKLNFKQSEKITKNYLGTLRGNFYILFILFKYVCNLAYGNEGLGVDRVNYASKLRDLKTVNDEIDKGFICVDISALSGDLGSAAFELVDDSLSFLLVITEPLSIFIP